MGRRRLLLFFLLLTLLAGCAAPSGGKAPAGGAASAPGSGRESEADPAYDLDLVQASPTIVYAEVYHMMNEPEDYVGKLVRMEGICASYSYPDHTVYGCIIADATACCKQGMEFVLAEDAPENYPAPGAEIVVSGRFHTYQAGEFLFCRLEDCRIEQLRAAPAS